PAPIFSAGLTGCVLFYAKTPYLEDCTARNNMVYSPSNAGGSGLTCRGFQLTLQPGTNALPPVPDARLSDAVFKRCVASRNITTCGGSATGFNLAGQFPTTDSIKSLTFEDCIATGNQALSPGLPPLWVAGTYALGDTVSFNNQNYISLISGNVNSPAAAPADWGITEANVQVWNAATSYATNTAVTYNGVLYAAKTATTAGNNPVTNTPNQWAQLAVNVSSWNSGTTYVIGDCVSYQGYNFYSLQNANLNKSPDAFSEFWGLYPGRSISDRPAYGIKDWNATIGYNTGSVVIAAGIIYVSKTGGTNPLAGTNIGNRPDLDVALVNWTPYNISLTGNVHQGGGFGFFMNDKTSATDSPELVDSQPTVFKRCLATHNKGLPVYNSTTTNPSTFNPVYSAGYYCVNDQRTSFIDCDAIDNVYGFFLKRCAQYTVRNCRSDSNVDLSYVLTNPGALGYVGEGFTDVGTTGTAAAPTQSTSLFEGNSAYNNGAGTAHVGPNGNYNIWVNAGNSIRPLLLECINATSACVIDPTNPGALYFAGKHNLSTINN
ncbi:MAG: hypothetical protein LLF94_03290, partial [Chlamydiales bacterium]|nr:hypothetical protein [Chlamydiales bacterium]